MADLGRSLCYAAALRVARFGTSNEHGDWETAHHVFTYCNAVHQVLKRINGDPELAGFVEASRAVLHGALAIYLIRYLNVPPARLPAEGDEPLESMPSTIEEIRSALMDAFDRQHQIDAAAHLVMRHLTLGHPPESIMSALARALLREDAGFHAYQMLEAGARQFGEWGNTVPGRHILATSQRTLQQSAAGYKPQILQLGYQEATSFMRTSHRRDVEAIGRGSSGAGTVPFL